MQNFQIGKLHTKFTFLPRFFITKNSNWDYRFLNFIIQQTEVFKHSDIEVCLNITLWFNMNGNEHIRFLPFDLDNKINYALISIIRPSGKQFLRQKCNSLKINLFMNLRKKSFQKFFEKDFNQLLKQLIMIHILWGFFFQNVQQRSFKFELFYCRHYTPSLLLMDEYHGAFSIFIITQTLIRNKCSRLVLKKLLRFSNAYILLIS